MFLWYLCICDNQQVDYKSIVGHESFVATQTLTETIETLADSSCGRQDHLVKPVHKSNINCTKSDST